MNVRTPSFSAQIVLTILAATTVMAGVVAFLGYTAMTEVDSDAARQEIHFVDHEMEEELAKLAQEQRVCTIWDEAVVEVARGSIDWMDRNIGVWMQTYYGHDAVYIVRPDGVLHYAALDERAAELQPGQRLPAEMEGAVARLRDKMAAASVGLADSTFAVSDLGIIEPVRLATGPALVAISPIVATTDRQPQRPGTEFVHVTVQHLDATLAARVAEGRDLQAASFGDRPPSGVNEIGYAVRDAQGETIAWLIWKADRPGLRMVHKMVPGFVIAGLFGTMLLAWLLRRLWMASQQLHKSEAEARYLANHDLLAGLPNRMRFEETLTYALAAERHGGPAVTLLSLDLDRFKAVNDSLGHAAGDELIQQVSERLRTQVRTSDTVARMGGDEFAVILLGMRDEQMVTNFCTNLIQTLSQPYLLTAGEVHVGASVGVVIAAQVNGDMDTLLRCADGALYRAKRDGRGRFRLFTPEMDDLLRRRREIELALRQALETGQGLEVAFQPIFDAADTMVAAEALARWPKGPDGPVSPEVFIGVAEECGLIHPLGAWILEIACRTAVDLELPKVAVNVSPMQLRREQFADEVLQTLNRVGLAPVRLELELTEHFHLDPGASTRRNLHRLREAGVTIALDDFATGQSLLQYVRDYEIDLIKIDRSFVSRLGAGDGTDEVVRAMVDLGRAMGLEVTAEGVETPLQRDILIDMGCRVFQGYLLGRPMEGSRLARLCQPRHGAEAEDDSAAA